MNDGSHQLAAYLANVGSMLAVYISHTCRVNLIINCPVWWRFYAFPCVEHERTSIITDTKQNCRCNAAVTSCLHS